MKLDNNVFAIILNISKRVCFFVVFFLMVFYIPLLEPFTIPFTINLLNQK